MVPSQSELVIIEGNGALRLWPGQQMTRKWKSRVSRQPIDFVSILAKLAFEERCRFLVMNLEQQNGLGLRDQVLRPIPDLGLGPFDVDLDHGGGPVVLCKCIEGNGPDFDQARTKGLAIAVHHFSPPR